ncbi:MAG TPA: RNB domain-containing ribonuclease, partial [Thermoleophilaceae bacterium]|nr:RNB domain-containing ribonuclease [Thermoleophilaceae bacterium]
VEMRGAEAVRVSFHRSVIRSDARLTYDQVDRVLEGSERPAEPWGEPLAAARAVAAALTERRAERGSLAVESSEPSFEFDSEGGVAAVRQEQQTEAHRLIEELMILANEQVAGYLADREIPTLYRVHERPDPIGVAFMVEQLASLGVPTPPVPERMSPQQAGEVAGEASRLVARHVARTGHGRAALTSLILRAMKQAAYSPRNVGHAGLASPRYCHFTSPIRRYPDLVAHRALLSALGRDEVAPRADELDEAGLHSSAAERDALQIEHDAADVCSAFLLERVLLEGDRERPFEGEVVGLIGAGAFVRFGEEAFEGFLPVRRMRDWWHLNEEGTALVAESSGRALRLGDPLEVAVSRVDPPLGRVDLVPAAG